MNDAEDDILAALWAAGALPAPQCRAARERVRLDPAFAAKAREWEDGLAPLALATPPLAPPSDAFAKIEARLDARARFERLAETLREPEGPWIIVAPGVRYTVLERRPEQMRQIVLLEGLPGAVYPAHDHEQDEEIYVISGDLVMDEVELGPGDFHVSRMGTRHPDSTTRFGCRCLVATAM
jgi:quercetin dioxygenase-like cupin family protein